MRINGLTFISCSQKKTFNSIQKEQMIKIRADTNEIAIMKKESKISIAIKEVESVILNLQQ